MQRISVENDVRCVCLHTHTHRMNKCSPTQYTSCITITLWYMTLQHENEMCVFLCPNSAYFHVCVLEYV